MIKKLSAVGDGLGLIIERPILELLDITKDTALEIKTDGEALIIRPVKLSKVDLLVINTMVEPALIQRSDVFLGCHEHRDRSPTFARSDHRVGALPIVRPGPVVSRRRPCIRSEPEGDRPQLRLDQ